MESQLLKKQYYIEQSHKTLTLGRIISPLVVIIIALFLYQDKYFLHLDFTLWYRLTPICFFSIFFILSLSFLKKHIHFAIPFYVVALFTSIFMILGIAYHIFTDPKYPDIYISNVATGIQTVYIVIFLIISGALRFIPLLFFIPLLGFIALIGLHGNTTIQQWTTLTNPVATSLFLSLLANIIEKRNFKEYVLNKKLEKNEEVLSNYKYTMEKELSFASQLHRSIMPVHPPSKNIAVLFKPYYNLGGDFYDFISLNKAKNKIGIFASDVTGHGISSAFITALLKHYLIVGKKYYTKPDKLLYYLNEYLTGAIGHNFVTALYCIIDFTKKELTYSNAAHYSPIIIHKDGTIIELPKTGKPFPLGIVKKRELVKQGKFYTVSTIPLKKGSKVVLYTDGIIEMYNSKTQNDVDSTLFFNLLRNNYHHSAHEIVKAINDYVQTFSGEFISDDICVIVIEV